NDKRENTSSSGGFRAVAGRQVDCGACAASFAATQPQDIWRKATSAPNRAQAVETSPGIFCDALSGIACGVSGELALESGGQREPVQPLHLGAGAEERGIGIGAGAVHHEGSSRQG